jgi:hypothetical protein
LSRQAETHFLPKMALADGMELYENKRLTQFFVGMFMSLFRLDKIAAATQTGD